MYNLLVNVYFYNNYTNTQITDGYGYYYQNDYNYSEEITTTTTQPLQFQTLQGNYNITLNADVDNIPSITYIKTASYANNTNLSNVTVNLSLAPDLLTLHSTKTEAHTQQQDSYQTLHQAKQALAEQAS